jgi:hypothetical protein
LIAHVTKTPVKFDSRLDNIKNRYKNETKDSINNYLWHEEMKEMKKQINDYTSLISSLKFKHELIKKNVSAAAIKKQNVTLVSKNATKSVNDT